MESNTPLDSELPNEQLFLNSDIRSFLKETAKWTGLIAIIGFIYVGLMVVGGLGMAFFLSTMPGSGVDMPFPMGVLGVFYAVLGLITLFPFLYLYRFSSNMKTALRNNSESNLTKSFSNLKSHYKFYGIFIIIVLVIYALLIIGTIFSGGLFWLNS